MSAGGNPCQSCGACCAAFRVDFDRDELQGGAFPWGEGVPPALTLPLTGRLVRMAGTDASPPRCQALGGTLGVSVNCSIDHTRPSPCREFEPEHAACREARRRVLGGCAARGEA